MQPLISRQLVPELRCNQEEADTQIMLHDAHAVKNGGYTVYLHSYDTNVAYHSHLTCKSGASTVGVQDRQLTEEPLHQFVCNCYQVW